MAAANQKAPQPLSLNTKLENAAREAPRGDLQKFMDRGDHGLHETGHRFVAVNHIETKLLTCGAIMFAPSQSQIYIIWFSALLCIWNFLALTLLHSLIDGVCVPSRRSVGKYHCPTHAHENIWHWRAK